MCVSWRTGEWASVGGVCPSLPFNHSPGVVGSPQGSSSVLGVYIQDLLLLTFRFAQYASSNILVYTGFCSSTRAVIAQPTGGGYHPAFRSLKIRALRVKSVRRSRVCWSSTGRLHGWFRMEGKPWLTPNIGARSQSHCVIRSCPLNPIQDPCSCCRLSHVTHFVSFLRYMD